MAQALHHGELFRGHFGQIDLLSSAILDEQNEVDKSKRVQEPALQQVRTLGDFRVVSAVATVLFDPVDHQVDELFFRDGVHAMAPSSNSFRSSPRSIFWFEFNGNSSSR